ncbi:MAG TPA: hypothetical protein VE956_18120 [Nodularia sp. (in: cyanobacteria)]|nr:hypothetical protein [Nodularia sp. (in: cyanobacteria)]
MSEQKPFLSILSFLGFQVNAAIEEGHGNKISFSDIYKGLEERNLFELLNEKLPGILDISLFLESNEKAHLEQRNGVLNALSDAASGMKGRERKKYGVESSGLSLLMAYILEAIQQEYWIISS